MIIWNSIDTLPASESREDSCGTYYLVSLVGYWPPVIAMYLDNEWWVDYTTKISVQVKEWAELTRS